MGDSPNVLLVMADQYIADVMGAYGNQAVKTPNLDKLASRGIRFESCYSPCPVCSPARAALMTGKYVSNTQAYDNAAPFSSAEPTFAHYLTNAGYDVVLSGKMHFVGPDQLHGFTRRLTTDIYPSDFLWLPGEKAKGDYADFHKNPISIDYATAGIRQWSMQLDYDEETHFRALEFLRSRRTHMGGTMQKAAPPRNETPFFLCVSYTHPHEPFHVTRELWDLYEGVDIELPRTPANLAETYSAMDKWLNAFHGAASYDFTDRNILYSMRRAYYGLVSYVDNKVGELVATLEHMGLAGNTIVVFTSDHGDMLGERAMVQKRCFYESSCRVPLLIAYPDGRQAGRVIDAPVSLVDLAPTFVEMASGQTSGMSTDGKGLLPLITGDPAAAEEFADRPVFAEMHTEGVEAPCFMVRWRKYKYIYIHGHAGQLFDLEEDPDEWRNLAESAEHAEAAKAMERLLRSAFDPVRIAAEASRSVAARQILKKARTRRRTPWDFFPQFDATTQYWREG